MKAKDPKWYAYWSQRAARLIALVRALPPESSPAPVPVEPRTQEGGAAK